MRSRTATLRTSAVRPPHPSKQLDSPGPPGPGAPVPILSRLASGGTRRLVARRTIRNLPRRAPRVDGGRIPLIPPFESSMRKITACALCLLALAGSARAAGAQACAGLPTVDGQLSFGASAYLPTAGTQWGAEASYDAAGPYSFFGGLTVVSPDDGGASEDAVGAGVAYVARRSPLGPRAQVCPMAAVGYNDVAGLGTATSLTLGVGIGGLAPGRGGATLHPYLIPQVVLSQFNGDDDSVLGAEDASDINFAVTGACWRASARCGSGPWRDTCSRTARTR